MFYELFGFIVRNILINLGPIFVKFGQILSYDYPILKDLYLLQNDCGDLPKYYFNYIKNKYNDLEFEDDYISSGSIAVVYKAYYKDKILAVKVKRPNIKNILQYNVWICNMIINIVDFFNCLKYLNLKKKISSLLKLFQIQCEFTNEYKNWEKFYKLNNNIKNIRIPKCLKEFCNDEILTMEYISGKNISEILLNNDNSKKILTCVSSNFISGIINGLIHGDLHSGNFAIDDEYNVIIYDFGIILELTKFEVDILIKFLNAVHEQNINNLCEIFFNEYIEKDENYYKIKNKYDNILLSKEINEISIILNKNNMDLRLLFTSMAKTLQKYNLNLNDKMQNFEFALLSYTNGISRLKIKESLVNLLSDTVDNLANEILNL